MLHLMGNLINVILNYVLIFGFWIFPKDGSRGSSLGNINFSMFYACYLWPLYVRYNKRFIEFAQGIAFGKNQIGIYLKKLFDLGLPSALQMFFEVIFFTAAIWLIWVFGKKSSQAANQIALNLSSMTFMFAMGLGCYRYDPCREIKKGKVILLSLKANSVFNLFANLFI